MGYEPYVATVVAIEQNQWPTEWAYMIQMEKKGKPPQLIMTILDRGSLNLQDTSTRISPKAMELKDGKTAFFFDRFERPIPVTIIEQGNPCFGRFAMPPSSGPCHMMTFSYDQLKATASSLQT